MIWSWNLCFASASAYSLNTVNDLLFLYFYANEFHGSPPKKSSLTKCWSINRKPGLQLPALPSGGAAVQGHVSAWSIARCRLQVPRVWVESRCRVSCNGRRNAGWLHGTLWSGIYVWCTTRTVTSKSPVLLVRAWGHHFATHQNGAKEIKSNRKLCINKTNK